MLKVYSIATLFIVVTVLNSVTSLECYQCLNAEKCRGEEKDRIVQCNNDTAHVVALQSSIFYPKLAESLLYNGNYQCVALQFTELNAQNASHIVKGCLFETRDSLCRLEADIPNGSFSCKACNTNKCNSGITVGWSLLLMVASLIASTWVLK